MPRKAKIISVITVVFIAVFGYLQSSWSDASTRKISSIYTGTIETVVIKRFENYELVEVQENIPPHLSDKTASSFFLVWEQKNIHPLISPALSFLHEVLTSIGCFRIEIFPNILATRPGSKEKGLLVAFSFNPAEKGSGFSPLPQDAEVVLRTAIQNSLLTDVQRERIEKLLQTYGGLLNLWDEFKKWPYDSYRKVALLNAISDSHASFLKDVGSSFYSREQRIALRNAGCIIRGHIFGGTLGGVETLNLRNFPLSELVSKWNGSLPGFLGLPTDRPGIEVNEKRKYDETDLVIEFKTSDSPHQKIEKALRKITEIEGIYLKR